ncbi:MAG: argininosuccinate synthase, partial [Candidatus Thiodiazotropha endolucinida]|nr:argininosuccinate synthase [Candidatus Thiodiazotropha taylori]MCW4349471.1 argininosuccinate synthase [Candidatus Thiodiazotropha endolucinida]
MRNNGKAKKICLAYSGGLDTTIIMPWLKENFGNPEIIAVCTNVGQQENWKEVERRAYAGGASKYLLVDCRREFIEDYLFPMARAGALYEGKYLLGTAIARPLQAGKQVEIALAENCDALAHGCTGKGNDQVRFELTYKALAPHLKVIAPWRVWDINSREQAIAYAESRNLNLGGISRQNIYSRDWNIWHISHEGGQLENPWKAPEEDMYRLTKSPQKAPDSTEEITIEFEKGIPISLNGKKMNALPLLEQLNEYGARNGIGRIDIVETRMVGMKSRGIYETPGGTLLHTALRDLEMFTINYDALNLKHRLAQYYSDLIYAGKWFTTARIGLDAYMESVTAYTTGSVRLALYKGTA